MIFRIYICSPRSGKTTWSRKTIESRKSGVDALYATYSQLVAMRHTGGGETAVATGPGGALCGTGFDLAVLDDLVKTPADDTVENALAICDWVEDSILVRVRSRGELNWIITPMARRGLASMAIQRFGGAEFLFGVPASPLWGTLCR